jgi:hypothetical protein
MLSALGRTHRCSVSLPTPPRRHKLSQWKNRRKVNFTGSWIFSHAQGTGSETGSEVSASALTNANLHASLLSYFYHQQHVIRNNAINLISPKRFKIMIGKDETISA